jgi:hypothetical protein
VSIDPISLGIQLALTAASMAFTASRKIEGPRLEDTKFNAADYGGTLTRFWGVRWIVPKVIFGEDLREVKEENKTKGGKQTGYKYFGTWGAMIAPHPIDKVTRVKADGHLVLDLTGAGPITPFDLGDGLAGHIRAKSAAGGAGGFSSPYFRVYTGAPGQEPDERMLATVEALNGVGSCPDYRGRSWVQIEELPLEKFGNRIPQLEIEAVTSGEDSFPYESFPTLTPQPRRLWGFAFSPDFSRMVWSDGDLYEIWDVAARSPMVAGTLPNNLVLSDSLGMSANGDIIAVGERFPSGGGNQKLYRIDPDGTASAAIGDLGSVASTDDVRVVLDASGNEHWLTIPWSNVPEFYVDNVEYTMADLTGVTWTPCAWFADDEGAIWGAGGPPSPTVTTNAYFYRMIGGGDGPDFVTVSGLPSFNGLRSIAATFHSGAFVLRRHHNLYRIDPATGAVLGSRTDLTLDVYNTDKQFANLPPGASTIWLNDGTGTQAIEISLADLSTVRELDLTDWSTDDADAVIYSPIGHALITAPATEQEIAFRYLDRATGGAVTLRTVVEDVCELAEIDLATVDATALTQTIPGYSVAGGTGKDWVEPLLDTHDVDARPHGFKLQFVNRGAAPSVTLSSDDFAAPEDGAALFEHIRPGATDVPAYLMLQFADLATDQQRGSTLSGPRGKADGVKPQIIDMTTLALDVDTAQQLGMRLHRRMAFDTGGISLALPSKHITLEPAVVGTLNLRDQSVIGRLISIEMRADRRFAMEWKRDDPSVNVLSGAEGASADGNGPSTIVVPGIVKGFTLDLPLLDDLDASVSPAVYVAAAPYGSSVAFPGAVVYQQAGGSYGHELASVASSAPATWGWTTDALADADPGLWDRGNSVNVMLQVGSLTGTTEAAIDADPSRNLLLIGDEVVNFATATLEGDGSYTLTGLKRGRRGTEHATGSHAARDVVLLLDRAAPVDLGLSEVGTNLSFKVAALGRGLSSALPIDIEPFTGASLKPYSPVHLRAAKQSNGDWVLSWVRRTRVGGTWTSGTTIPLGEASEEYAVTLGDGVSSDTKTVTSTTTYTWTVAAQTTDTGGEVLAGDLAWSVAQVSDAVGAGFLAEAAA